MSNFSNFMNMPLIRLTANDVDEFFAVNLKGSEFDEALLNRFFQNEDCLKLKWHKLQKWLYATTNTFQLLTNSICSCVYIIRHLHYVL